MALCNLSNFQIRIYLNGFIAPKFRDTFTKSSSSYPAHCWETTILNLGNNRRQPRMIKSGIFQEPLEISKFDNLNLGNKTIYGRYKIDLLMQRKQSSYCEVHFFNLNSKSNIQPVYNFLVHYYIYLLSHLWPYGGMSPIIRSKWDLPRGEGHWIVCTHEG